MRRGPVRRIPAALLLTAAAAATAVSCGTQSGSAPATPPPTTATTTVTTQQPQPSTTTPPPPPAPATTPPAQADPASVVNNYFAAINAHDYRTAWALGGKNLNSSYAAFVHGFADTVNDTVSAVDAGGSTVDVGLAAEQSDGSVKVFDGTYTVRDGVIVSASIHEVTTSESSPPPSTGPDSPSDTSSGAASFDNCSQAHAAHRYSIPRSDPAYAPHLDADHDGYACEPYESPSP
ncbi:excalibur calcium-binding domain-containing protein [Streptomyces sp. CA-111067]|uniref:excalibur calcium-binding domain-containing protein n=1 Tax=Streptomyces sp. CA-111067 TaxID=3240046 RepID=UPI003D968C2E